MFTLNGKLLFVTLYLSLLTIFPKLFLDKELSEKISRLQNVENKECSHETPVEEIQGISLDRPSKKRKSIHISEGPSVPYVDVELDRPSDQLVSRDKGNGAPSFQQVPKLYTHSG